MSTEYTANKQLEESKEQSSLMNERKPLDLEKEDKKYSFSNPNDSSTWELLPKD